MNELIFFGIIALGAWLWPIRDSIRVRNGKSINHSNNAWIRGVLVSILSILLFTGWYVVPYVLVGLVFGWAFFDVVMSWRLTQTLWYIGKTAGADKWARRHIGTDGRVYLVFKGAIFFVSYSIIKVVDLIF